MAQELLQLPKADEDHKAIPVHTKDTHSPAYHRDGWKEDTGLSNQG